MTTAAKGVSPSAYNQNQTVVLEVLDRAVTLDDDVYSADCVGVSGVIGAVTLSGPAAIVGRRHRVNAVGGNVTVLGGAYPLAGGGLVVQGSATDFELALDGSGSMAWYPVGGSGNGTIGEIFVDDLAALEALPTTSLQAGIYARVLTFDQPFELDPTSTVTVDSPNVVAALDGGRWLRHVIHVPKWCLQAVWYVDPTNGNDENDGASSGEALKTIAEWCRRVVRLHGSTSAEYTINLLGALPTTDVWRPTGEFDTTSTNGSVFSIVIKGQRTAVPIDGGSGATTGTTGAGCLVTAPSTNTQAVFDGGTGFVPAANIGKMVVVDTGGSLPTLAWIERDNGGTLAQVSEYVTVDSSVFPTPTVTLVTAPAAGRSYQIVDMTSWGPDYVSIGSPLVRHRFLDVDFAASGLAEAFTIRNLGFTLITCRIERRPGFIGANGTAFCCGMDFSTLTTVSLSDGANFAWNACGFRNVEFVPINGSSLTLQDSSNEGGYVRSGITSQATPAFGGSSAAGQQRSGATFIRGTRGYGNFRSTRAGIIGRRKGDFFTTGPLYGSGNTTFGADIAEGASLETTVPATITITGTSGDVVLDGLIGASASATAPLQSLENAHGQAAFPETVALSTWAGWRAAVVLGTSGFGGNVVSYKTGASITTLATT